MRTKGIKALAIDKSEIVTSPICRPLKKADGCKKARKRF